MRNSRSVSKRVVTVTLALLGLTNWVGLPGCPSALIARSDSLSTPSNPAARAQASEAEEGRVRAALENMPLYFIKNGGQVDRRVAYYVQGSGTSVYFTTQGVTFALTEKAAKQASPATALQAASLVPPALLRALEPTAPRRRWAVKLDFMNPNPQVKLKAQDATPAVISYFRGRPDQWKTGLETSSTLVYEELWPGIDLIYSGSSNGLKYRFVVKPGADPSGSGSLIAGRRQSASTRLASLR